MKLRYPILVVIGASLIGGCEPPAVQLAEANLATYDYPAKNISTASLKGSVLLIDFWATWCGPCRETIPEIEAIYQAYKGKGLKEEQVKRAIELSADKYCSASIMLKPKVEITHDYEIIEL